MLVVMFVRSFQVKVEAAALCWNIFLTQHSSNAMKPDARAPLLPITYNNVSSTKAGWAHSFFGYMKRNAVQIFSHFIPFTRWWTDCCYRQLSGCCSQLSAPLLCRDDETSALTLITSRVCFYLDRTLLGNQRIGRIGTIDNGTGIKQILSIPIPVKIISTNIQVKVNEVVLATSMCLFFACQTQILRLIYTSLQDVCVMEWLLAELHGKLL